MTEKTDLEPNALVPNPEPTRNPDEYSRVIVLIYGTLEGDKPFWCYVAVKPTRYQHFLEEQREGILNLQEFTPYGEIIIYGEGSIPPEHVTLKVAEVYQTDPKSFFEPVGDPEEEAKKKLAEIEGQKE